MVVGEIGVDGESQGSVRHRAGHTEVPRPRSRPGPAVQGVAAPHPQGGPTEAEAEPAVGLGREDVDVALAAVRVLRRERVGVHDDAVDRVGGRQRPRGQALDVDAALGRAGEAGPRPRVADELSGVVGDGPELRAGDRDGGERPVGGEPGLVLARPDGQRLVEPGERESDQQVRIASPSKSPFAKCTPTTKFPSWIITFRVILSLPALLLVGVAALAGVPYREGSGKYWGIRSGS